MSRISVSSSIAPSGTPRHPAWQAAHNAVVPVVAIKVAPEDAVIGYQVGRIIGVREECVLEQGVCYDPVFRYRINSQAITIVAISATDSKEINIKLLKYTDTADSDYANSRVFG